MAGHQFPGRVTSINEHHSSGKHASIEVTHGKRKRSKGPDGTKGELQGYDRPSSRVTIPKEHAKNYTMGQKVNVGITPCDDQDDGDEDDAPQSASMAKRRAAPSKSGAKGKKSAKKAAPSPIAQAMMPPRRTR